MQTGTACTAGSPELESVTAGQGANGPTVTESDVFIQLKDVSRAVTTVVTVTARHAALVVGERRSAWCSAAELGSTGSRRRNWPGVSAGLGLGEARLAHVEPHARRSWDRDRSHAPRHGRQRTVVITLLGSRLSNSMKRSGHRSLVQRGSPSSDQGYWQSSLTVSRTMAEGHLQGTAWGELEFAAVGGDRGAKTRLRNLNAWIVATTPSASKMK